MAYKKSLISFSNPIRATDGIVTYAPKYEQMPFDGMIFNPKFTHEQIANDQPISVWNWSGYRIAWSSLATSLTNYKATAWRRFSKNYILLKTTVLSPYPVADWFNPDIDAVIWNAGVAAAYSAQVPFCPGIFFDPEPDNATAGNKIWNYSDRPCSADYSFAEVKAQVRQKGSEWMEAIQSENPNITVKISFGFEQGGKENDPPEETDNYGLWPSFLDGMLDAIAPTAKIHNFYEDGYAHYLQVDLDADQTAMRSPSDTLMSTKRYAGRVLNGNASRQESLSDANLQTSIERKIPMVDRDMEIYNESSTPFFGATGSPTQTAATIAAIKAARVTVGIDWAFDPYAYPGLIADFNPTEILAGLSADDPITSYTDQLGNVYAQSGSARPLIKSSGIASGVPAALFASASNQYLDITNFTTLLKPLLVGVADIPLAIFFQIKCTSTASSQGIVSISRSATTEPRLEVGASTSFFRAIIKDDAGGNTTTTGTIAVDTNAHIVSMTTSGTNMNLRVDGTNAISTNPYATWDYSTQTFDRMWIGASAINTPTNYANANIGRVLVYNAAALKDRMHNIELGLATPAGITVAGA